MFATSDSMPEIFIVNKAKKEKDCKWARGKCQPTYSAFYTLLSTARFWKPSD